MYLLTYTIPQDEGHSTSFYVGITYNGDLVSMNSATQDIKSLLPSALGSMLIRGVLIKILIYPTAPHFTLCQNLTP